MSFINEGLRRFGAVGLTSLSECEVVEGGRLTDVSLVRTERGTTVFLATFNDALTKQNYQIHVKREDQGKLDLTKDYLLVVFRANNWGHLLVCEPDIPNRDPFKILVDGNGIIFLEKIVNYSKNRD